MSGDARRQHAGLGLGLPKNPLPWETVRRLFVRHAAPAVGPLGFVWPGRTMRRFRPDFVDVIDARCGKWNDHVVVSFGCGLRPFTPHNPKPWDCAFDRQVDFEWPYELLQFRSSEEEQAAAFEAFGPFLAAEAARWFGLLPDAAAARAALDRNTARGPNSVGVFNVPSPYYHDVVRQLETMLTGTAPPEESSEAAIRRGALERAQNPEVEAKIRGGYYVPLWYLLEHPFPEVARVVGPAFLDAGFSPETVRAISLPRLVAHALGAGGGYWAGLALGWVEEGFPIDEEIVAAAEALAAPRGSMQQIRHRAFRVLVRWRRSRDGGT